MEVLEVDQRILTARAKWQFRGDKRPSFALRPREGQESVWDYPRPPLVVADARRILVMHGDRLLADTRQAVRVLETASPPTFYIPPGDVDSAPLSPSKRRTLCEWKGLAQGFDLPNLVDAAWAYIDTFPEFACIAGFFSFYPAKLRCSVDGELVRPQPGGYYGGWITSEVIGPYKGEPGSEGWW